MQDQFLWAFSSVTDHPRITFSRVSGDSADRRPDFHLLQSTLEKYPWMVPEKVLWEELTPDESPDPVVQVSRFSRVLRDKYFVGFSFRYKLGAVRTLGDVGGQIGGNIDLGTETMIARIGLLRSDRNNIVSAMVCHWP